MEKIEIKKRLVGVEDIAFDDSGKNISDIYTLPDGSSKKVTKINASALPVTQETRNKFHGKGNVDEVLQEVAEKFDGFASVDTMQEDTIVNFSSNDTIEDIQNKINSQKKNLGGFNLTFVFPESLNQILSMPILFNGFLNGTLNIIGENDNNRIIIYDLLDIECLFMVDNCQANVYIKNFSFVHQYSKYAIKCVGSPAVFIQNCSFVGNEDSTAVLWNIANGSITDCTFYEDKEFEIIGIVGEELKQIGEELKQIAGKSIGEIFTHPSAKPPPGSYLLNGQTIYNCQTEYKQFWAWLQDEIGEYETRAVYGAWQQPELTSNGIMGGNSYACTMSQSVNSGLDAFYSFSNRNDNAHPSMIDATGAGNGERTLTFYSPDKLKISMIELMVLNTDENAVREYQIQGSNNGSSWTALYTGSIATSDLVYGKSLYCFIPEELQAGSENGWNYIRMNCTATTSNTQYTNFPKIFITAQKFLRTKQESTGYMRAINAEEYEAEIAQYGVCGAFVVDTNTGAVRLPNLVNAFIQTGDSTNRGQTIGAGLPNITGAIYTPYAGALGAFTSTHIGGSDIRGASGAYPIYQDDLDASRANDTYGKSDTVQPLSIKYSKCIQVFNVATALSEQESAQLASEMQMKAQTDLGNVTNASQSFKTMSIDWGMPDYTAGVDITSSLTNANAEYIVPYDCMIMAVALNGGFGAIFSRPNCIDVNINDFPYTLMQVGTTNGNAGTEKIYCQKGMKIYCASNMNNNWLVKIYPLKGANK